jgi:hypothetical protein
LELRLRCRGKRIGSLGDSELEYRGQHKDQKCGRAEEFAVSAERIQASTGEPKHWKTFLMGCTIWRYGARIERQ